MLLKKYIKNLFFISPFIFFLASCGMIGGGKDVDVSENAVLSGPPLTIPPEFDVESSSSSQQETTYQGENFENFESEPTYQGENFENFESEPNYQTTDNENLIYEETANVPTVQSLGEVQSFENYNPNNSITVNRQQNYQIKQKPERNYRRTVPSDAYNFSEDVINRKRVYAKRKKEKFVGFGEQENSNEIKIQNVEKLSQEEEFLLEDILNTDDTQ